MPRRKPFQKHAQNEQECFAFGRQEHYSEFRDLNAKFQLIHNRCWWLYRVCTARCALRASIPYHKRKNPFSKVPRRARLSSTQTSSQQGDLGSGISNSIPSTPGEDSLGALRCNPVVPVIAINGKERHNNADT